MKEDNRIAPLLPSPTVLLPRARPPAPLHLHLLMILIECTTMHPSVIWSLWIVDPPEAT